MRKCIYRNQRDLYFMKVRKKVYKLAKSLYDLKKALKQ